VEAGKRRWLYGGLAVAAGVGLVATMVRRRPKLVPGARVLLIGDSLAVGLATPMGQLASGAGVAFERSGVVGSTIKQWAPGGAYAATVADLLAAFVPTLVLMSLGTNDMKLPDPTVEAGALAAIVAGVRAAGAAVVWVAPPTMPFDDRGVRAMIAGAGVDVFPSDSLSIPRAPDGIHPNGVGYAGWAGAIWTWLT
jgi:lysophospholipase L1-like esterase